MRNAAVNETLGEPRPVFQRVLVVNGIAADVYTLWTSAVDTPRLAVDWPAAGRAQVELYDIHGRRMLVPLDRTVEPGSRRVDADLPGSPTDRAIAVERMSRG